ncbi:DUF6259 domain-containing protein [Nocardia sp. NBC_00403]|uniref:DUF6259 domain-containing protein n=1 Tax=Nocardia sp. NBC_00403 TaxID=2975990 RepID=UPI002E246A9C
MGKKDMSGDIRGLESDSTRVGIAADTGALVAYVDVGSGWSVVGREPLGISFRLLLPLEGRRNNSVFGVHQRPPSIEADGTSIELRWNGVRSQFGGEHDIRIVQRYRLDGRRLTVETNVDNRSDLIVENVFSPCIGDLRPAPGDTRLESIGHDYGAGSRQRLWPTYENNVGYFGVDVPTQLSEGNYGTPAAPYRLIQGDAHGLYLGVANSSTELVAWHSELWPGYGDSLEATVPETDEIDGHPVAITYAAVHLPFIRPGESRDLTPLFLEVYDGDWHVGADIYRKWRDMWFRRASAPEWAREPHSWLQIQINSPEDELRLPFERLVEVGRECAAAGVAAIQLVGWNDGGQDRNNPSHQPEPRLGGFDALAAAIAEVQTLGVKVILFAKFNWADRSTAAFREHFIDHAVKDPYGDYYMHPGYRYETVTQILDINTRRLVPMCFLYETYLEECARQFQIIVDLGADGMLFDECQHHSPTLLCFDEQHGHRYGAPTYANDRELIHRLDTQAPEDFLYAGEGIYDWQFDAYTVSYHRSEDRHHLPLHRYTQPHAQFMTAVTGFNDRNMIAQCLLYRYIVSYEPFNFKGRLPDFPSTVAYGGRMDALRRETRAWTWDGRFTDTVGASVTHANGRAHHPYTVFEAEDGSHAVAVANYDPSPTSVTIRVDGYDGLLFAKAVDTDEWLELSGGRLNLGPRSAAVVLPRVP